MQKENDMSPHNMIENMLALHIYRHHVTAVNAPILLLFLPFRALNQLALYYIYIYIYIMALPPNTCLFLLSVYRKDCSYSSPITRYFYQLLFSQLETYILEVLTDSS